MVKILPNGRETDAAFLTLKQCYSKAVFQIGDGFGKGGLRYMQGLSGTGHVFLFGNDLKIV